MSNVRTIKTSNYVQLHNKAGLDKELSSKAKGALYTAMALPPEYDINKSTFHQFFKDGRDSIKGAIEELVLKGYGFHEQTNGKGGFSAITLISDVKLTTLAKLDEDELETFVADITEELLYALKRIRETGKTYIGELHNTARKKKEAEKKAKKQEDISVTENPSREISPEKSVTGNQLEINKYSQNVLQKKEEEEIITNPVTESMILDLMNQKIKEREITNQKTIKAIHDVVSKCKAIGTTDLSAAENYVIKVVEEKMSKLGQKQKVRQGKAKVSGSKPIRTEMTPDWVGKEDNESAIVEDNGQASEEDRKRLEEVLKKYKKD
ncbi:hypothetical protein [Bacillus toyonensis]|uniref:hypothetical protein n=1 Tax=Bacillus toyonensis TaxID=155322 RepID=UPI0020D278CD|nr:hypothetical protein [Bacillus toyonensis]